MSSVHQLLDRGHLRLLLALRDTGRLAAAADLLHITPSAASHRLREAERRIGVPLVVPRGRSLALTVSGRHLADTAQGVEDALSVAEHTARWLDTATVSTLRLAEDFHDTAPWAEILVGDPDVSPPVSVIRVGYDTGRDAVARRIVDLAVEVVPADRPPTAPVVDDRLAAVVPVGHPAAERGELTPADIVAEPYVTAGEAPGAGFEHDRFIRPNGAYPPVIRRVESVSTILRLVARGRGISILPRLALLHADDVGLAVVPLAGTEIDVRWEAVTRPEPDTATLAIVETLRERATGLVAASPAT